MPESYTGNEGTTAFAAGMAAMDGNEDRRNGWLAIGKTRDYIVSFFNSAKAYTDSKVAAIPRTWAGITGKPSTFPPSAHTHTRVENGGNWFGWQGGGTFGTGDSVSVGNDLGVNGVTYVGDVRSTGHAYIIDVRSSGQVYVPNASPASSGYSVAYINGDGRLSRSPSAAKYKKHISPRDPSSLGDIWPDFVRYQLRTGDGSWKYGYIADEMAQHPDQAPFVIFAYAADGNGENVATDEVESIDFIGLLLAQTSQLHQTVETLTARLTSIENPE